MHTLKNTQSLFEEIIHACFEEYPCWSTTSTSGSPVLEKRKFDEEFAQWSRIRGGCLSKSELDAYLEEVFMGTDERFKILC
jgi:hypothetical protein